MLKMRERNFRVYPPYWFFRARAALDAGDNEECRKSFTKFNEVWRPVLRYYPFKVGAVKFQISELSKSENISEETLNEIKNLVEIMRKNTPEGDWNNNLFAGMVYFALGDYDNAVTCVEENILFDFERELSETVLAQMKNLELARFLKVRKDLTSKVEDKQLVEALISYFEGNEKSAEEALERMSKTSKNPVVFYTLSLMNVRKKKIDYPKSTMLNSKMNILKEQNKTAFHNSYSDVKSLVEYYAEKKVPAAQIFLGDMYQSGKGVEKDYDKALRLFAEPAEHGDVYAQISMGAIYIDLKLYPQALKSYRKAAEQNFAWAQNSIGYLYYSGVGVEQNNRAAYMWVYLSKLGGNEFADEALKKILLTNPEKSSAEAETRQKFEEIKKRNGIN